MPSIFWGVDKMRKLANFDIPFTGLPIGSHHYQFDIEKSFFDNFEFSEISEANFNVEIDLDKQSNMLILHFDIKGKVEVLCDTCGDLFDLPVSCQERIIVKFGDEEIEQTDEIWVIPHHEHKINVADLIYEFTHLALPVRRVHPEGECNEEAISNLNKLESHPIEENDPRWDKLKKIKKDLK